MDETPTLRLIQVRHNDEEREKAYQLWAYRHSRNGKAVAEFLDIPYSTVADWVSRYGWPDRVRSELRAIAPDLHESTVADFLLARREAMICLREMLRGERKPNAALVNAIAIVMEKTGLDKVSLEDADPREATDLDSLTPEERLTMQRDLLTKWRGRKKTS